MFLSFSIVLLNGLRQRLDSAVYRAVLSGMDGGVNRYQHLPAKTSHNYQQFRLSSKQPRQALPIPPHHCLTTTSPPPPP